MTRIDRPEYFHAKALRYLRQYLNTGRVTQQVIYDMLLLAIVEMYGNNANAVRAHLRSIKSLLDEMGGLEVLELYVRDVAVNVDLASASSVGAVPLFELTWDPGPLTEERSAHILARLSASSDAEHVMGRALLKCSHLFDSPMSGVLEDIVPLAQMAQYFWQFSDADASDKAWVVQRSYALMHRLLSIPVPIAFLGDRAYKQECCRLALIVWLGYLHSVGMVGIPCLPPRVHKVQKILYGDARRLRLHMESANATRWAPHEQVLHLWILGIGALVSCDHDGSTFFSKRFVQVASQLQVGNYQQLEDAFGPYLWLDRLEQGGGRKLTRLISKAGEESRPSNHLRLGSRRSTTTQRQVELFGLVIVQVVDNNA